MFKNYCAQTNWNQNGREGWVCVGQVRLLGVKPRHLHLKKFPR